MTRAALAALAAVAAVVGLRRLTARSNTQIHRINRTSRGPGQRGVA